MTIGAVIALTLVELEDEDLLVLVLLKNLTGNLLRGKSGSVSNNLLAVVKHKNIKLYLIARLRIKLLDADYVALGNLILLATSCYDCVHVCNPSLLILATINTIFAFLKIRAKIFAAVTCGIRGKLSVSHVPRRETQLEIVYCIFQKIPRQNYML